MRTEEQIRKTEYAKALNRIKELENDIETLNRNNGEIRKILTTKEKQIDELESKVEDLKSQMEDRAMFALDPRMSMIDLMALESVVGEITL